MAALQATAGNRAVSAAIAGDVPVQRGFGSALKAAFTPKTAAEKREAEYRKVAGKAGGLAGDASTIADVSIAVTAYAEMRSRASMTENGHGWIEIDLKQPYASLDPTTTKSLDAAMGAKTKALLPSGGHTSVGFYPGAPGTRAIFAVKGIIREPEKSQMLAGTAAKMSFPVGAKGLAKLLKFIKDSEASVPTYSFLVNNCTDWAVKGLKQAGINASSFLGKVTTRKLTSPNKVYKRIYERAALGFGGAKVDAELKGKEQRFIEDEDQAALTSAGGTKPVHSLGLSPAVDKVNSDLVYCKRNNLTFVQGIEQRVFHLLDLLQLSDPELAALQRIYAGQLDLRAFADQELTRGHIDLGPGASLELSEVFDLQGDLTQLESLPPDIVDAIAAAGDPALKVIALVTGKPLDAVRVAVADAVKAAAVSRASRQAARALAFPKNTGMAVVFSTGGGIASFKIDSFVTTGNFRGVIQAALKDVGDDEVARFIALAQRDGLADGVALRKALAGAGIGTAPPEDDTVAPHVGDVGGVGGAALPPMPVHGARAPDPLGGAVAVAERGIDPKVELESTMVKKIYTLDSDWAVGGKVLDAGTQVLVVDQWKGDKVRIDVSKGGIMWVPAADVVARLKPLLATAEAYG